MMTKARQIQHNIHIMQQRPVTKDNQYKKHKAKLLIGWYTHDHVSIVDRPATPGAG